MRFACVLPLRPPQLSLRAVWCHYTLVSVPAEVARYIQTGSTIFLSYYWRSPDDPEMSMLA
eukprot:1895968-Rhodomonas_salina.1